MYNLIQIKAQLSKEFHLSPVDIDMMPMWEYEMWMDSLSNLVKEQNDEQQEQMDKYHVNDTMKMTNPNNMSKMMNPKVPEFKMPAMPKM